MVDLTHLLEALALVEFPGLFEFGKKTREKQRLFPVYKPSSDKGGAGE